MEGGKVTLDVLAERARGLDARTRSNHDSLGKLREKDTKRGEAIVKINEHLDNQDNDIEDLKKLMTRILWGLFGAIAVGLMFVVAVASLIVQSS